MKSKKEIKFNIGPLAYSGSEKFLYLESNEREIQKNLTHIYMIPNLN